MHEMTLPPLAVPSHSKRFRDTWPPMHVTPCQVADGPVPKSQKPGSLTVSVSSHVQTLHSKIPALRSLGVEQRSEWFRDDCHHSDAGGEALGNLLAKLLLWAVRQPALTALKVPAAPSVPAALDAGCWCNGKTIRVGLRARVCSQTQKSIVAACCGQS
ncbi:unnamed protein product [Symbiodinium necroappetens]|uniref:Uncharacterized protein n=1 Tax=Symbiodinium necroappetens TaxID=1628268 RepID=A0A812QSW1_9DINO|nr:unnamed protein product [Symbiodinium necroappetens]